MIQDNKKHWEFVSSQHPNNEFYDLEALKNGGVTLNKSEIVELGTIDGLNGIHFQCGIGLETISLQMLGANMTGVDFAQSAINQCNYINDQLAQNCRFICSDIMKLDQVISGTFDFGYTSHGVLRWLDDIDSWAKCVASMIRKGGFFYMFEIHPLVYRMTRASKTGVVLNGHYFDEKSQSKRITKTHCGAISKKDAQNVVHTNWTISSVINCLLANGFKLQFFNEHEDCSYSRKNILQRNIDGYWRFQDILAPIPLSFSMKLERV